MRWLVIVLLFIGCSVDEVGPLLGTGGPVADGGMAATLIDGAVPRPGTTAMMVGDRVLIYEPGVDPRRVLQGGDVEIAATDLGVMIVFEQNIEGRVILSGLTLTKFGQVVGDVLRLTPDSQAVGNELIAARGQEVGVFYSDRAGTITLLRLDSRGRPLEAPLQVLPNVANNAALQKAIATPLGYAVAWTDDRASTYTYVPFVAQMTVGGRPIGEQVQVRDGLRQGTSRGIGALVSASGGLSMTWAERQAGGPDYIYHSSVTESEVGPRVEIYAADSAIGGTTVGLADGSLLTAIWDLDDEGIYTVQIAPDGQPQARRRLPVSIEMKRPQLAHAGGTTVALLASAGDLRPSNPLATQVYFALLDTDRNVVHSQIHLNAEASQGRCIEDFAMVKLVGDDAFGVVWTEGCSGRRMYFSRVEFTL